MAGERAENLRSVKKHTNSEVHTPRSKCREASTSSAEPANKQVAEKRKNGCSTTAKTSNPRMQMAPCPLAEVYGREEKRKRERKNKGGKDTRGQKKGGGEKKEREKTRLYRQSAQRDPPSITTHTCTEAGSISEKCVGAEEGRYGGARQKYGAERAGERWRIP